MNTVENCPETTSSKHTSANTDTAPAREEKCDDEAKISCGSSEALENTCAPTTPPPAPLVPPEHPGWRWWRGPLRAARLVVAPMVDASELAWRMLSRRYGAELCYTPMLHSAVLVRDARYRRDSLQSCASDRPLIVQLCGNDPSIVGEACSLVSAHCDGVDLNLGCPQAIARKGRYGAYLMDDLSLVRQLVEAAVRNSSVPVSCKIRVFSDLDQTIQYARMLQDAGASLLTVHGRTRDQKGPLTGLADWSYIAAVRAAVDVPVFANGNIQYYADVERCLKATGAQGVMSAEGNLHNPAIFVDPVKFPGSAPTVWQMALEYLQLAEAYPCPISYSRGHIFKLLHHCFSMAENSDVRQTVSRCSTLAEMKEAVSLLRDRMAPYVTGQKVWVPENEQLGQLPLRPWLCQPYVRVSPAQHKQRCDLGQQRAQQRQLEGVKKRLLDEDEEKEADLLLKFEGGLANLSKKKAKKLLRNPRKKFLGSSSENLNLCVCRSPRGGKCEHALCKACCKAKCYRDNLDCTGHRVWVKTNRRKATTLPPKSLQDCLPDDAAATTGEGECEVQEKNFIHKFPEENVTNGKESVTQATSTSTPEVCKGKQEMESSEPVLKDVNNCI